MILDQADIDALLTSTARIAADGDSELPAPATAPRDLPQYAPPLMGESPLSSRRVTLHRGELARILQMRFPIIVVLAERQMELGEILRLNVGSIIEFDRSAESELGLLVGNRRIGEGQAVKVGEFFGLRVTQVDPVETRIRALGG